MQWHFKSDLWWQSWNSKRKKMTSLQICNFTSANRCYFKNVTAFFTSMEHWAKTLFVGFWKDVLLAELHAQMSRRRRFLLFLHHNYQVSLTAHIVYLLPRQACVIRNFGHGLFSLCDTAEPNASLTSSKCSSLSSLPINGRVEYLWVSSDFLIHVNM